MSKRVKKTFAFRNLGNLLLYDKNRLIIYIMRSSYLRFCTLVWVSHFSRADFEKFTSLFKTSAYEKKNVMKIYDIWNFFVYFALPNQL